MNKKISSISVDQVGAAYKATMHLLDIGRKKLLHIAAMPNSPTSQDRMEGFNKACDQHNISDRIIIHGDYTALSGYNIVHSLLASGVFFDGIFAGNDQMAIGAMRACKDNGLVIPDDISIVGFDDILMASIVEPALTTIKVPQRKMGVLAINKLLDIINNSGKAENIVIDTSLVIRESTIKSAKKTFISLFDEE